MKSENWHRKIQKALQARRDGQEARMPAPPRLSFTPSRPEDRRG